LVYPKASILWVNYNSEKIIKVVLESIYAILNLNYPNYEVIIVDNGSTDKSFDKIRQVIESHVRSDIRIKVIKLDRNRGFNTANNIAFQARDKDSRYVVLLNNDAVPTQDSLLSLIEIMEVEKEYGVAAIQGIITTWDGTKVDNMGFIVDELLFARPLYRGQDPYNIKKPHYCTFVSGAYSIYAVDAVKKVNEKEMLFDSHMFAYFDDKVLGLKLWYHGFKVKSFPIIAARHYGSATFGKLSSAKMYLTTRNFLVLCTISFNLRYKPLIVTGYLIRRFAEIMLKCKQIQNIKELLYAFTKAILHVDKCNRLVKYRLDATKLPLKRLGFIEALHEMLIKFE